MADLLEVARVQGRPYGLPGTDVEDPKRPPRRRQVSFPGVRRATAMREIPASLAALDSLPLGDPLHLTLLYLRWVTPGASTARTCSSCTSASRRLSKRRAPSPSTTGTT